MRDGYRQAQSFPRGPVIAAFHNWFDRQEWDGTNAENQTNDPGVGPLSPLHRLAMDANVTMDLLYKLKSKSDRDRTWIDFDLADKIITAIDPHLWRCDPDLAKAYQEFDLARLDERRPIVKAA